MSLKSLSSLFGGGGSLGETVVVPNRNAILIIFIRLLPQWDDIDFL